VKLSAQEEYGLRCLLQIAAESTHFLPTAEIARREGLSTAYVAKLMRVLRRAGLVRSVRGQQGGFALSRGPDAVEVAEVLEALGGRLYVERSFCIDHPGERRVCVRSGDCALRALWSAMDKAVQDVLRGIRLSQLMCGEAAMTAFFRNNNGPLLRRART
jgi:Rrf2 family protein